MEVQELAKLWLFRCDNNSHYISTLFSAYLLHKRYHIDVELIIVKTKPEYNLSRGSGLNASLSELQSVKEAEGHLASQECLKLIFRLSRISPGLLNSLSV